MTFKSASFAEFLAATGEAEVVELYCQCVGSKINNTITATWATQLPTW